MLVFYTGTVMVNIDIIEKHSVIDVSDSTIFTTKNKENVELLIFTPGIYARARVLMRVL